MPFDYHAAQLALCDVHAAGQLGIVLGHGDKVALMHVLRAGDDLHGLARADVDLADPHVVGVFVLARHGQDLADDDIVACSASMPLVVVSTF